MSLPAANSCRVISRPSHPVPPRTNIFSMHTVNYLMRLAPRVIAEGSIAAPLRKIAWMRQRAAVTQVTAALRMQF